MSTVSPNGVSRNVLALMGGIFLFSRFASAGLQTALVYNGPGSCTDSADTCAFLASEVANRAGFNPVYVGPQSESDTVFTSDVSVWIQPGGVSSQAGKAMSLELRDAILRFVARGGAYVGFCAGAFMAADKFYSDEYGLGLIQGDAILYPTEDREDKAHVFDVGFSHGPNRGVYWQGGPYFAEESLAPDVKPFAWYPDHKIAGVFARYGLGRVVVIGAHPEASAIWFKEEHLPNPGDTWPIAMRMIRWAAGNEEENP